MPGLDRGISTSFFVASLSTGMTGTSPAMTSRRRYVFSKLISNSSMNYRHAFHAGGFADVIKHIVLVRMLTYLQEKPSAFRVIDTHAGAGRYDLTGDEARRSGEWLTGIARVMQARFSENALPLVAPYLDIVRAFNAQAELKAYPGSPLIARAMLRPQDRITACEI